MANVFSLLANSPYKTTRDLVNQYQSQYPSEFVYRPVGIEIEITNHCNLKCAGCAQQIDLPVPKDLLSTTDYLDIWPSLIETEIFAYSITGGEAFLYPNRIYSLMQSFSGYDLYKLNTNGFRFTSEETTFKLLAELKSYGFSENNKIIKPVLVVSLGQQNLQPHGVPIANVAYLAAVFYEVFDPNQATLSINITDQNLQNANKVFTQFKHIYKRTTGKSFDSQLFAVRKFELNNIITLKRLNLISPKRVTLPELLSYFQQQYLSWKCLNQNPDDDSKVPGLNPRLMLRPNGDVYACPGYNYVHKIGNVLIDTLPIIIERANENPILKTMYNQGLPALVNQYLAKYPQKAKEKFSISFGPCDICQYLTQKL